MTSGSFMTHGRFVDNKNYPRGLSRHGHFTIKEAQLLEKFGIAFNELDTGKRFPTTLEEENFVLVCRGKKEALTDSEKVWMKYLSKIKSPKKFHTLSGGKPAIDSLEDFSDNEV